MDDDPPPYDENFSGRPDAYQKSRYDGEKRPWSLDDQTTTSRAWLLSAAAEKVHGALQQRALYGITRSTLLLIPSGQDCDLSAKSSIMEFENKATRVILTGESNGVEFWSQNEAVEELRRLIAAKIGAGQGSRLRTKIDELHVRSETAFGLIETKRIMAVVVHVE